MFTHPLTTDSVQVQNHRLTKKRDVVAYKNRAFSAVKKPCGALKLGRRRAMVEWKGFALVSESFLAP